MGPPFKGVDRGSIPRGHTKTSLDGKMSNPMMNDEVVVRIRTTCWHDKNGLNYKRSLTFLRRKSSGFNVLEQDASDVGADYASYGESFYSIETKFPNLIYRIGEGGQSRLTSFSLRSPICSEYHRSFLY